MSTPDKNEKPMPFDEVMRRALRVKPEAVKTSAKKARAKKTTKKKSI